MEWTYRHAFFSERFELRHGKQALTSMSRLRPGGCVSNRHQYASLCIDAVGRLRVRYGKHMETLEFASQYVGKDGGCLGMGASDCGSAICSLANDADCPSICGAIATWGRTSCDPSLPPYGQDQQCVQRVSMVCTSIALIVHHLQ